MLSNKGNCYLFSPYYQLLILNGLGQFIHLECYCWWGNSHRDAPRWPAMYRDATLGSLPNPVAHW